jgi:hypothetical protein
VTELTISAETVAQLKDVANQKGTSADELAEQAIRQFLRSETRRMIQRESKAFRAMHAQLFAKYPGQYVAIYQGRVIDHDEDQLALFLRVDERYPQAPLLIKRVLSEPEKVYVLRSPRCVTLDGTAGPT